VNPEQILSRLKTLGGSLSVAQRTSLVAAFVTVVGLVAGSGYLLNRPTYVLLFSDLDAEAASSVVGRLKALKVTYQLGDGGRTVRVPETRVDELRLEFAAQGMPSNGRIGFEIFDKISFGATEFIEQVNFRRALEGEIARTISTIGEVSSARVHIATAKSSLFESRERPATASVVLKLRGSRPLASSTIQGITGLVAAAVEGLRPEAVVVLDSYGRMLSKQGEPADSPAGGPSMERQLVLERDMTSKLVTLLEPVVGEGRVRVNVAVRLNNQSEEQTEERWDPTTAVVRGRQVQSDTSVLPSAGGGVAGARANLPDAAKPAPDPVKPPESRMAGRSAETTNYEISRLTRHTIKPNGEIARLSVAVILDDEPVTSKAKDGTIARKNTPRTHEELQKIQGLVSAAVGLDATRGDQLTVENVSFDDRPSLEDMPEQSFWQRYSPQLIDAGRVVTVFVFGLMAFLMIVRPLMSRVLVPLTAEPVPVAALPGGDLNRGTRPPTVEELEGAIEAELDAAAAAKAVDQRKVPVLSRRVGALTQKQPDHAAQLVRAWIQEDRR
jgi:flagellar M-ring protein FliF